MTYVNPGEIPNEPLPSVTELRRRESLRNLVKANTLLSIIAFLIALGIASGIVLGWIAYDRLVDRIDIIEKYTDQIVENTDKA